MDTKKTKATNACVLLLIVNFERKEFLKQKNPLMTSSFLTYIYKSSLSSIYRKTLIGNTVRIGMASSRSSRRFVMDVYPFLKRSILYGYIHNSSTLFDERKFAKKLALYFRRLFQFGMNFLCFMLMFCQQEFPPPPPPNECRAQVRCQRSANKQNIDCMESVVYWKCRCVLRIISTTYCVCRV